MLLLISIGLALLMGAALYRPFFRDFADFIDCVRSRKKPVADVEAGHRSTLVAHLGNIAYRLGRTINFDPEKQVIVGDAEASKMMSRSYRSPFVVPAKV